MKVPITWSKLGNYALTSALFVFFYAMLTGLLGMSRSPTTIKQFLVLYVLHLGLSLLVHFYMNRREKSSAPPEAE